MISDHETACTRGTGHDPIGRPNSSTQPSPISGRPTGACPNAYVAYAFGSVLGLFAVSMAASPRALLATASAKDPDSGSRHRVARAKMDVVGPSRDSAAGVPLTCPACRISVVSSRSRAMCPFCGSFYNREANSDTSLRGRQLPREPLPHIVSSCPSSYSQLDYSSQRKITGAT